MLVWLFPNCMLITTYFALQSGSEDSDTGLFDGDDEDEQMPGDTQV